MPATDLVHLHHPHHGDSHVERLAQSASARVNAKAAWKAAWRPDVRAAWRPGARAAQRPGARAALGVDWEDFPQMCQLEK